MFPRKPRKALELMDILRSCIHSCVLHSPMCPLMIERTAIQGVDHWNHEKANRKEDALVVALAACPFLSLFLYKIFAISHFSHSFFFYTMLSRSYKHSILPELWDLPAASPCTGALSRPSAYEYLRYLTAHHWPILGPNKSSSKIKYT